MKESSSVNAPGLDRKLSRYFLHVGVNHCRAFRLSNIPSCSRKIDVLYVYSHRFGERKKNCNVRMSGSTNSCGRQKQSVGCAKTHYLALGRVTTCCPAATPPFPQQYQINLIAGRVRLVIISTRLYIELPTFRLNSTQSWPHPHRYDQQSILPKAVACQEQSHFSTVFTFWSPFTSITLCHRHHAAPPSNHYNAHRRRRGTVREESRAQVVGAATSREASNRPGHRSEQGTSTDCPDEEQEGTHHGWRRPAG
jgi:hypothetical protein